MKRFQVILLLAIAASSPAIAQPGRSAASVSPHLGLADFIDPMICTSANICATVSPASAAAWRPAGNNQDAGAAERRAALPGPTPRPEPAATPMPQV